MARFPLDLDRGIILVEVVFVGRNKKIIPVKMVMDTGASITTIPVEVAVALGANPAKSRRRIEMTTASGMEYLPMVTIAGVKFFNFEINNVDVVCHTLPPGSAVLGLLGLNILKRFNIHLKFRENLLEVFDA